MTIEPPQPPTAPAPAIRPTPPTPPRIDKTPFAKNSTDEVSDVDDAPQVTRQVETPETQARDAVANGSGPLTKRTVERGDDEQSAPANQTVTVIPPDAPIVPDTQSDYDRGKDVLRQFREMDARESQSTYNPPAQTTTEQPRNITPKINYHEGHGGVFWIFTIIFVAIAAFVIVKKFLFTDKPTLTKSQLFEDSTDRLKAAADKVKPVAAPPKPAKLPPKKDDDKGKHFEVRV
ncbi:MAG: hypothetical protein IJK81_07945 [Selenomonadaceae bacterium]|nr:hypothetical protein [Selenomonadaceae bacterium]